LTWKSISAAPRSLALAPVAEAAGRGGGGGARGGGGGGHAKANNSHADARTNNVRNTSVNNTNVNRNTNININNSYNRWGGKTSNVSGPGGRDVTRTQVGNTTLAKGSGSNNVYAGRDGQVYRRDEGGGGWQKYEGGAGKGQGSWSDVGGNRPDAGTRPSQQPAGGSRPGGESINSLDRQAQARTAGEQRAAAARQPGGGFQGGSGFSGGGGARGGGGGRGGGGRRHRRRDLLVGLLRAPHRRGVVVRRTGVGARGELPGGRLLVPGGHHRRPRLLRGVDPVLDQHHGAPGRVGGCGVEGAILGHDDQR